MKTQNFNYKSSIAYVFVGTLIALGFSGWLGEYMESNGFLEGQSRYLLQAFIMFGMVIGSILLVRKYVDAYGPLDIGTARLLPAIRNFCIGASLVALPLMVAMGMAQFFNWTSISVNLSPEAIIPIFIGFITVLLFEAIPEEFAFRGYIFGALRSKNGIWTSAITTVLLFVIFPVILFPIQQHVLGMNATLGPASTITGGYLITMAFFGSFVMLLRVLTGSIWMGVGFHCLFVFNNRLIGITDGSIIQIGNQANEPAMKITLIICYLLMFALVIGNALLNKRNRKVQLATK